MNVRVAALITIPLVVFVVTGGQNGVGSMAPGSETKPAQIDDGRPQFNDKNELLIPKRYREWIFVGSSLGLGYDEDGKKPNAEPRGGFKHAYINRLGYNAYRDTGRFPVGTMLILEGASRGQKTNPQLRGWFSNQFSGMEAAVKTGDRFDDPWTYYMFPRENGKLPAKGRRIKRKGCINCHSKHAKTDHVFTQFYPVLRNLRPANE